MAETFAERADRLRAEEASGPISTDMEGPPKKSFVAQQDDRLRGRAEMALELYRDTTADQAFTAADQSDRSPDVLGAAMPSDVFLTDGQVKSAFYRAEARRKTQTMNPRLAAWATEDPTNAVIAREFATELNTMSGIVVSLAKGGDRTQVSLSRGVTSWIATWNAERMQQAQENKAADATFGDLLADERKKADELWDRETANPIEMIGNRFSSMMRDLGAGPIALGRQIDAGLAAYQADGSLQYWTEFAKTRELQLAQAIQRVEDTYARGAAQQRIDRALAEIDGQEFGSKREKFAAQLAMFGDNPIDGLAWVIDVSAQSFAPVIAGAATTALTRSPAMGRAMMTTGNYSVARSLNADQIAREMGYDLTTREGVEKFWASPDARMIRNDRAATYALVLSAVDHLSFGVSGTQMAQSAIGEFFLQGLTQAAMGSSGEWLALLSSGQDIDPLEIALEGIAEFAFAPIEQFGAIGGTGLAAVRRHQSARDAQAFFAALADTSTNSELRAKAPKKYREAIAALTKDGPVAEVQIDASGLDQLLQSGTITVDQLIKAVPSLSADQIALAISEGTDISIPTAEYATSIAGSDLDAQLRKHMRLNGSMTAVEMEAMNSSDLMAELDAGIREVEAGVRSLGTVLEAESTRLENELIAAGRAPSVARAEATQLTVFADVVSRRLNMPIEKFLKTNPLPRVFRREDGAPIKAPVDQLRELRAAGGIEGTVIEAAALAAGLTEDATNEELADALVSYAANAVDLSPEAAASRMEARAAVTGRTLNQSSITTIDNPLPVTSTGGKKGTTITNQDIARTFTDDVISREGRKLDPLNNPADRAQVIKDMMEEIAHQLDTSEDSGDNWYVEDISAALEITARVIPELALDQPDADTKRMLFLATVALLSPQNNPVNNWEDGVQAFSGYLRTGEFTDRRPHRRKLTKEELVKLKGVLPQVGKQLVNAKYRVSSGTALPVLSYMVKELGEVEALVWLTTRKTAQAMGEMRRASGVFKGGDQSKKWQDYKPNDMRVDDVALGMAMFGPKVSDFMLNATGIDPDAVTVDLWLMRTLGRHRGTLLDASAELLKEGGIYDQPLRADREVLDDMITDIAKRLGKRPSSIQAILWYYEQRLWRAHGAKTDSRNFKQGAEGVARKRGIDDGQEDSGPAARAGARESEVVTREERQVTEDDLYSRLTPEFFGRPGWAILTADDSTIPDARLRVRLNTENEVRLQKELDDAGIPYRKVTGFYGTPEPERSFLILADQATAEKIGRRHMQDSVLTRDGLIYTRGADRPNTPVTGTFLRGQAAIDAEFYSRDDSGMPFALGLDFSKGPGKATIPLGMKMLDARPQLPVDADGKVVIYHWSDKALTTVDPTKAGSGPLKNVVNPGSKTSFWGVNPRSDLRARGTGYVREPGLGTITHTARVDAMSLYPANEDPDGLRPTEGTKGQIAQKYALAIKAAGYLGSYVTDDGKGSAPLGNVVTIFDPVEVTQYDGTLESVYTPEEIAMPLTGTQDEQLAQLAAMTEENKAIVRLLMAQIDEKFGVVSGDNVKAPENIVSKSTRPSLLAKRPWFTMAHIRDTYRFKTSLKDFRDLPGIMQILVENGVTVVKSDTAKFTDPAEWGWRIISFDLRMPNGQLIEYYLPMAELEAAKKEGHLLFENWRNLTQEQLLDQWSEYSADIRRSRELYQAAFDAALSRLGMDMPAAEASFASAVAALAEVQAQPVKRSEGSGTSSAVSGAAFQTPSYVLMQEPPSNQSSTAEVSLETSAEKVIGDSSSSVDNGSIDVGTTDVKGPPGTELFQSAQAAPDPQAAFKAWFGNSKVVDKNGEAMVVYHASKNAGFFRFAPARAGKTADGGGMFFTDDLTMAATYTGTTREVQPPLSAQSLWNMGLIEIAEVSPGIWRGVDAEGIDSYEGSSFDMVLEQMQGNLDATGRDGNQAGVYHVYLSMQDPYTLDAKGANWSQIATAPIYVVRNPEGDILGFTQEGDVEQALEDLGLNETEPATLEEIDVDEFSGHNIPDHFFETTDSIVEMARDMNFDGVIIRNVNDGGPHSRGGESGDLFVVFQPEQVKSIHNAGTFLPTDPNIYRQGKRGAIYFPDDTARAPIISLFETADLSTVLHESGHYFLRTYENLAAMNPEIAEELELLKGWWGENAEKVAKDAGGSVTADDVRAYLANGPTGDAAKDAAIYVGMQEQFARAYETYLFEGKTPSARLSGLFETFSAWLVSVYKVVTGKQMSAKQRLQMNDQVRGVFDRMLATDEELQKARAENQHIEMIAKSAEELGVTDAEYAELVRLSGEAQDEARRTLQAEIMKPMLDQRRQQESDVRKAARAKAEATVNAKPVHRVKEWLGNSRWLDGDAPASLPADLRMDTQLLIDTYGETALQNLPKGKRPLYVKGSGLEADEVAMWFGFPSGKDMLDALRASPDRETEIRAETDRLVTEELGDPLVDGTAAEMAIAALNGNKRGELIAAELRALSKQASKSVPRTTRSVARMAARRRIAMAPVREATAYRGYLQSMQRAALRAQQALATGDFDLAYNEKRKELLNHALYMEGREAAENVAKWERKVARLKKPGTRKNIDGTYLSAIDEILDRYDFRQITQSAERRRGALNAYVQMMIDTGREGELAIPAKVLAEAARRPYKTIPYQELRGVIDALDNIEHTGRRKKTLIDAKRQRDLDISVDEAITESSQFVKGSGPARTRDGEGRGSRLRHFANLLLNADTLLREYGGFAMGKMYDLIKADIDAAGIDAQRMRVEAGNRIKALYDARYDRAQVKRMGKKAKHGSLVTRNDQMAQFSKWDLISMALNMGNEANLERLMDKDTGYGYTQQQVDYIKSQLTDGDWDFVQSAWDYINEFWPLIEAREMRQTGVAPAKVEALEVVLPSGRTLPGGYYPIKYDTRIRASLTSSEQIAELQKNMMGGRFGKAQTRNGHTIERAAGSGGRVLEIGMQVFHGHIAQVVHDLAYSEAVANSWRVLQHPTMVTFFENSGRTADREALELWVQDVATGNAIGGGDLGRLAMQVKSNFTLSKLAFNMSTVIVQLTGISQSAVVVGKLPLMKAYANYAGGREKWGTLVKERSTFMAERETTFHRDIYDMMGDQTASPLDSAYKRAQHNIAMLGFLTMQKVQYYGVDIPTWMAAYDTAVADGKTDAEAVVYADRMVARSQASGLMADRSAFERGTISRDTRMNGFVRLFSALGSYMFAKGNIAYERANRGQREVRDAGFTPKAAIAAASATVDLVLLFTLEAILYALIKGTIPGEDDDDDGDGMADEYAKFLAAETAFAIMGTIPVLRDMSSSLRGFGGGGAYGAANEALAKPFLELLGTEDVLNDGPLWKALSNAGGLAIGFPSAMTNRLIDGYFRLGEGDDVAPVEWLMGRRDY